MEYTLATRATKTNVDDATPRLGHRRERCWNYNRYMGGVDTVRSFNMKMPWARRVVVQHDGASPHTGKKTHKTY